MNQFRFRDPAGSDVAPQAWLRVWSARYPTQDYSGYGELIAKHRCLSPADVERIGRWKDAARTDSQWQPNVASVAYRVWMDAAAVVERCPDDSGVPDFLLDWSERNYTDQYARNSVTKHFGLSRASTLLHFLSGGRFPIFDSRVRKAVGRLLDTRVKNSVQWYLDSYCPLFAEIAAAYGTTDLRLVDKALFSYGGRSRASAER